MARVKHSGAGTPDDLQFRRGGIVQLKTTEGFTRQQVADLVPKLAALGLKPTFAYIGSESGTPDFEQMAAFVERNWPQSGSSFVGKEHIWYALHLSRHQGKSPKIIKNLADRVMDFVVRPMVVDTDAPRRYGVYPETFSIDPNDHRITITTRDEANVESYPNNAFARSLHGQQWRHDTVVPMVDVAGLVGFYDRIEAVGEVKFSEVGAKTIDALGAAADVLRPYVQVEGLQPPQILR